MLKVLMDYTVGYDYVDYGAMDGETYNTIGPQIIRAGQRVKILYKTTKPDSQLNYYMAELLTPEELKGTKIIISEHMAYSPDRHPYL